MFVQHILLVSINLTDNSSVLNSIDLLCGVLDSTFTRTIRTNFATVHAVIPSNLRKFFGITKVDFNEGGQVSK